MSWELVGGGGLLLIPPRVGRCCQSHKTIMRQTGMANDFGHQDSPFGDSPSANPYEASVLSAAASGPVAARLPTYVIVMLIVSIVFCVFRLLLGVFGLIAIFSGIVDGGPVDHMEVALNLIGSAVGLGGAGLMLAKQPSGLLLGWVHVVAIVLSIGVGVAQAFTRYSNFGGADEAVSRAMLVGFVIGGAGVLALRVVILVLYVIALLRFRQWSEGRR